MRSRAWRCGLGTVVLLALGPAIAPAQEEAPVRRSYSSMLNIDALLDNYGRMLARKYNLTPEQDAYTQQLLREQTNKFMEQHRDHMFLLVDRLFDVRAGGDISVDEMMEWGRQAQPLYEQAKQVIITANNQWRGILNEEQKRIHDADLQLMYQNFAITEDQLHRLTSGQMTPEEFRMGGQPRPAPPPVTPAAVQTTPQPQPVATPAPQPPQAAGQPAPSRAPAAPGNSASQEDARARLEALRNARKGGANNPTANPVNRPRGRAAATPQSGMGGADFASRWEQYVEEFIRRYQLDDAQTQRARTILKDCQEQANSYLARQRAQLDELDKKIQSLAGQPEKSKELQAANERKAKLTEPIERIFERQLKPRLERIPTTAQREAAGGTKTPPPPPARPGQSPSPAGGEPRKP
ncbi:MAG: hypothetical protein IPM13_07900 [Phycisphaerales bacterium]|nr:hypothetical protein [Phycisphaerales bacterium]